MSLILPLAKWAWGKLTGVLGYDCVGKPLRAGDKVIPAPPAPGQYVKPQFRGVLEVTRMWPVQRGEYRGNVEVVNAFGEAGAATPAGLRKLGDEEKGDWSELSESTGWTPSEIKHKEETHHESP